MAIPQRLLVLTLVCLCLPACKLVETQLEGQPAEAPPAPAQPAPPPAPEHAAPPAPAHAEPAATATEAAATATEAATTAADAVDLAAGPAIETAGLAGELVAAGQRAVSDAVAEVEANEQRQVVERQRQAAAERLAAYISGAQNHLRYLAARAKAGEAEPALLQLALVQRNVEGMRRNLPVDAAADDLTFALGALYATPTRDQEAAVVRQARQRLVSALQVLPVPAAGQADRRAALAQQVTEVLELLDRRQHRSARNKLQDVVLQLDDGQYEDQLAQFEAARQAVLSAVARRAWPAAQRAVARLDSGLQELVKTLGPAAAPPPAAAAAAPSPAPDALSDEPARTEPATTAAGATRARGTSDAGTVRAGTGSEG